MIVLAFRARLPKAADGGPIALVRDGDTISINVAERRMELEIDESAWEACRAALPAFESSEKMGWLNIYQRNVQPLTKGGTLISS